jgi:hypothetical protein
VDPKILGDFSMDIAENMQKYQDNISLFGDFEKELGPGMFNVELETPLEEFRTVIGGHTFEEFPNVLKQTMQLDIGTGGVMQSVAPEYILRSKIAGSVKSIWYDREGLGLSYKRIKDFPDVISLAREASRVNKDYSDIFGRVAKDYQDYLFGSGIEKDAVRKADWLSSNKDWVLENPEKTTIDLVRENFETINYYRDMVKIKEYENVMLDQTANLKLSFKIPSIQVAGKLKLSSIGIKLPFDITGSLGIRGFIESTEPIIREAGFKTLQPEESL